MYKEKIINENERYLILLLKSILLNEKCIEKPDNISFEEIFRIAKNHNVSNMAYYGILKLKNKPEKNLLNKWKSEYSLGLIKNSIQEAEKNRIIEEFNKNEIKNVFLKGFQLKELYPKPDMRVISDLDILIKKEDREKCKNVLENLKYIASSYGRGREDVYLKKPVMNLEVHNSLFDERDKRFYEYFQDLSNLNKIEKVREYNYNFSLEDAFIYNLAHTVRHFEGLGTGIRSVIDHWLFVKKKGDILNWEYIESALKRLNIYEFHKNLLFLGEVWFEDREETMLMEQLGKYILTSGTYGINENYILNKASMNLDKNRKGKIYTVFKLVFPDRIFMRKEFPILENKGYLLIYFYFKRIVRILMHQRTEKKEMLLALFQTKKSDIEKRKEFYKKIGL